METHVLPKDFFVTQKFGGVCFRINELPPETLSHIFELGSMDDGFGEEQDKASGDVPHTDQLDAKTTSEKDTHAYDVEMVQRDENKGGDGESASDDTGSSATVVPFAFVVSYVCQYWRNVALSTPSLWTTIVVTPEERPPFERVSTLLERSKNLPIDITVSYGDLDELYEDDFEPPSTDLEILFAMLIPHIHRWQTIKVTASEYYYHHMYAFLSAVSDHSVPAASQLTTLELHFCDEELENDSRRFLYPTLGKHFTLFAGSAPLLTRIVLWGVHVDWDQPWIASASNLTFLELAYHAEDVRPSWAQFSTILRGASVLQKFSLRHSGPSGEPPVWSIVPTPGSPADVNAPIQLVRVTDFILECDTQARTIGLLRKFYLPTLKHLALDPEGDIDEDFGDLFRELTRPASAVQEQPRSLASRLESLEIPALPCQVECIETLYGELQNLRSLNLSLYYFDPFFFDIISTPCTLPGHGDIWLPRLATLYVYGASGIGLRKLVLQRKVAGVPLSSLYVDRDCGLDDEDVDWLKENVNTFKFIGDSDEDSDGDLDEDE
ncbi:hypothetical protein L210DRAFT_904383 [Boletus edulis BED1]|uniref:F-box domain-containing protein n=1 Tax=Boletus edulis BED1 TaxID=1328754 RepID=A0AAD4G7R9_BOLED|nr:hypothetical protein L210DRAFT_904383 [Boletus edulis BED1]